MFAHEAGALQLNAGDIIKPNSSASGYYIMNNTINITQLNVNGSYADFIGLNASYSTVAVIDAGGAVSRVFCAGKGSCSVPQTSTFDSLLFVGAPRWSSNATSKTSPQTYNAGIYGFQINWSSSVNIFANATFQLGRPNGGLTNYTNSSAINTLYVSGANYAGNAIWYINFTQDQLGPVGTYNYTWFGIDIGGAQNKSDTVNYAINTAPTLTRLFLNGTEGNKNYNLTQTANFTVLINISGKTVYLGTNISGWSAASGSTPLYNYTQMQSAGIYNITGWFAGDENYSASSATYYANVTSIIGNITVNLAFHIGSIFADDYLQNGNNYGCVQDGSGWFGLTTENPQQAQSGNLSADYNINVSFTSDNKAYLAFGKGSCANFGRYAADAQLKRFLSPLAAFSYPKTNLIQLILQFNKTDVTNDAHWGKGVYQLSIANQGYNSTSAKQNLAVNVLK